MTTKHLSRELAAEQLERLGARLEPFLVVNDQERADRQHPVYALSRSKGD